MSYKSFNKSNPIGTSCLILAVLIPLLLVVSFYLTWGVLIALNWLLGFLGYQLPFELTYTTVGAVWGILTLLRLMFGNNTSSSKK